MSGRGKTKRARADEPQNRLGTGLEQQLEEETTRTPIDKKQRDRKYREKAKFVSETCKAFCMLSENGDKFKTYVGGCRKGIENERTNKSSGMDNMDKINYLYELEKETEKLAEKGTPSEPPMGGRKEEPAEALWGKMPATADDCTSTHLPIGGTQLSGLVGADVAKCHGLDQTTLQSDVPPWTTLVRPGMGPKVDPVSPGFHCKTRPPQESCNTEVISKIREMQEGLQQMQENMYTKMQEGLQQMQENMYTKIQYAFVAALEQLGICQQTIAPIVSPAGPHHNPLGKQGGTNATAGSSGGPTTQSFLHNEENVGTNENLHVDSFPNLSDLGPETRTGCLEDIVRGHGSLLQSSPTRTTPLTVGVMNSTATEAMGTSLEREEELKRKRGEELDGNHRSKRPVAAYNTPSSTPIGGFMAETHQDNHPSAVALATEGYLLTNEGTQIQMIGAAYDEQASTLSRAPPQVELKTFTCGQLGQESIEGPGSDNYLLDIDINSWDCDSRDWNDLDPWLESQKFTGNLAVSSDAALGAMNSIATGGEPHHDRLGMQGETTAAAGSSGGRTTQSSAHNAKL